MARPRSAGYDDQRDQILARAAELFARGAAQNDISTVANISASASTPTQLTDMEFKA